MELLVRGTTSPHSGANRLYRDLEFVPQVAVFRRAPVKIRGIDTGDLVTLVRAVWQELVARGSSLEAAGRQVTPYRVTSLIRNVLLLGSYRRPMPRALRWFYGGGKGGSL